ncbi:ATP-binding protein [Paracoccus denitrificans]|jgi:PAS domain S-box-containing protein|nr:ATP-binding protein [Paracoccus denitrificans]MBB4630186.1 PAS domain S-box-containing protein [Paracoccus denitrificans]MCU7431502.1 ATP-binding protein [Paracoccus denitrificans]UPV95226.1 ATP-binding protein [Paracoccus denitrificans]WQO32717.1 ATP-binding protein [Paracoccus denitrificans]
MADEAESMTTFAVLRPDGLISYCSAPFAHLLGSEERVVVGTPIGAWLRPVEGAGSGWFAVVRQSEGHLLRTGGVGQFRYRLDPMAGGGAVLHLMQGTGNLDPIYARAFQLNPGLSALSVLDTGEHLDVNDAWLRNMEYRREEVIGRTASEMQVWEQGDTSRTEIVRRLREDGKIENFQARMRTRTGKLRDILVSAELVEHAGRKLAFFASHDITEVKKAQEELEALNRQLEQRIAERTAEIVRKNRELAEAAERAQAANEAKSQFLSVMSHEIRTPLNALLNMAELLIEDGNPAPAAAHLSGIASSARALAAIVDDVLDFSRIESGHLEIYPAATDIGRLCEEAVRGVAPLAHRKGLDIVLTFGQRLPATAMVDPLRLRQILFNLVGNAIKYTRKGWIEVRADVTGETAEPQLLVEVIDTGIGIRPNDLERIFERFSRIGADANHEIHGAGLGLNISAGLARAMGGTIRVESEVDRGSAFRVTLPLVTCGELAEDPLRQPLQGRVALLGPATRTRSTFEAILKRQGVVAQRVLSASGAQVITMESGRSAIDCAMRQSFDILLLDLRMPDLSGYETAVRIRALGGWAADVPIVAVSANIAPDKAQMQAAGIDGFLAKPFTPTALRAKVQGHLHHSAGDTEPDDSIRADATPVLDESFLAAQVTYAGPDAVGKAIAGFLGNLDGRLSRIWSGADARERADAAHMLAGAAGALGLLDLATHCRRLASDRGDSPTASLRQDRDILASSAGRAVAALREVRDKLAAGSSRQD